MPDNELLDEGVRYAEASDVARYVRNKEFDSSSDPTQAEVEQLLLEISEDVDKRTRRAWRLREVNGLHRTLDFDQSVESPHRRRRRVNSRHGFVRPIRRWGIANLPHPRIVSVESLEVLMPESAEDITSEQGRDGHWWLDNRSGTLRVDLDQVTVGPIHGNGIIQPAKVRVTYRYGRDENAEGQDTTEAVSSSVPGDVRRATAKLAAAELLDTDQYGSVVASGPENVPNQSAAAERLRASAEETIQGYSHKKVL